MDSPKGVLRSFRAIGMLSEDETVLGLHMVNERNLTVHTYNEELAVEFSAIHPHIISFCENGWSE
ncbi:hypothetical protein J2Z83_001567 [Virgibacillus natechei]|uniref:Uncharacterized protein n=2 Tax=Virgibacillus natechei TaxID=1216297 RepID=A0ABS4IEU8_9BACI|nr:hypothetical protein [Virgibacillus natechei]